MTKDTCQDHDKCDGKQDPVAGEVSQSVHCFRRRILQEGRITVDRLLNNGAHHACGGGKEQMNVTEGRGLNVVEVYEVEGGLQSIEILRRGAMPRGSNYPATRRTG